MTEEDLERAAEDLADEAVAGYDKLLQPEVVAEMRQMVVDELLCTDEGRAQLRRLLPDPVVAESSEVDAAEAQTSKAAATRKAGSGRS